MLTQNQKGILTVLGGFFTHLVCGALFNWGTLNIYMTSYFRSKDDPQLSIRTGIAIYPVMMCCVATGMPLGIQGIRIFGSARNYLYFASFLTVLFQFLSCYTTALWQYILVYSVGFGITTGTIYYIPIYMGYLFFPNRKGLVVGCVLCGYGLSSFVFGMIFFSMVNPENLNPEKAEDGQFYFQGNSYSVVENIPQAIRYCCIIYTVLLYLGSSLVFYHPEQIGEEQKRLLIQLQVLRNKQIETNVKQEQSNNIQNVIENQQRIDDMAPFQLIAYNKIDPLTENIPQSSTNIQINKWVEARNIKVRMSIQIESENKTIESNIQPQNASKGAPNIKTALCSRYFAILMVIGILSVGLGVLVNSNYKTIGKKVIVDDYFMTIVGSLANVANGISRPIWSNLIDKYPFKRLISVILILQIFLALTLQLSFVNKYYYLVQVFFILSTLGGVFALFPAYSAELFGVQVGSKIFGLYWYGFGFANLVQFLIISEVEESFGFVNIFYLYGGLSFLCLILVNVTELKPNWQKYSNTK